MSHVMRKHVFRVCDQVRLKPACSATETSYSLEILDLERRGIINTVYDAQADLHLFCLHTA